MVIGTRAAEPMMNHESTHCSTGAAEAKGTKRMGAEYRKSVSLCFRAFVAIYLGFGEGFGH
jgi:hypothetical protein